LPVWLSIIWLGYNPEKTCQIEEYFHITKVLSFNGIDFNLSWSSHPTSDYYKQEYIPVGENLEHFNDMLTIEFFNSGIDIKEVVERQVLLIVEKKKRDPVCNYKLLTNEKKGEYILDFVISGENGSQHSPIEWNAYRYIPYQDNIGHKGIILLGVTHRAYGGEEILNFLKNLGNYRNEILPRLIPYPLPPISIN